MDKELFTQVFPVLTAFAGGILGFLANLFVNRIEYSRQVKRDKEEHLRELYNEFSKGITSTFKFFDDIFEVLLDIKGEKLSRKREAEIEDQITELEVKYSSQLKDYYQLEAKFNFVRIIDFAEEFEALGELYHNFNLFTEKIEEKKSRRIIGEEEAEFVQELSEKHEQISDIILAKMEAFYSDRYLPKK